MEADLESKIALRKCVRSLGESYTKTTGQPSKVALPSSGGGKESMSRKTEDLAANKPP